MEVTLAPCPDCRDETEHELLRASPSKLKVRCLDCDRVHAYSPKRARELTLPLVWSDGDISTKTTLTVLSDDEISVGAEFEFEGHRMYMTTIEANDGRYVKSCLASNVKGLYAKLFDTVTLKLSVNEGDTTTSFTLEADPDDEVPVGLVVRAGGCLLAIKTLKSDQNRTIHRGMLLARNVRRAFCDPAPRRAKKGDVVKVRNRGAPEVRKGKAPSSRVKGPRGQ